MNSIKEWLKDYGLLTIVVLLIIAVGFFGEMRKDNANPALKEYKDGIQNHLTWDIKGQCFFVRPNDDVTVYLIRVTDCDRK
jgi:hypothetical protein